MTRIRMFRPFLLIGLLVSSGVLSAQSVAIIYDQENPRRSALDEFAASLRKELSLQGTVFTTATWNGDTALIESILTEWSKMGDGGSRSLAEKNAGQLQADEYIYLKLREDGARPLLSMHWIGTRNEVRREGVIPLDIPFSGADALRVRSQRASEVLTGNYTGRWLGTLGTAVLPGTGQWTKAEPVKAALFLAGALGTAGFTSYSAYQARLMHNNYAIAANSTLEKFYYDRYSQYNLLALLGAGVYGALSLVAGLDYFLVD